MARRRKEKSVEELTREFEALYRKNLHELEHPPDISLIDLQAKIVLACLEINLPPVTVHMVDRDQMSFAPVDGIVRESSLPAPERKDVNLDIGYLMETSPWSPHAKAHSEFCMNSGIPIDIDELTERSYWSTRSFYINSPAFKDKLETRFVRALKKNGLDPQNITMGFHMGMPLMWNEEHHRIADSHVPRYR